MFYLKLAELYETLESTSKRLNKTYHIAKLLKNTSEEDLPTITLLLQGRLFPQHEDKKIGVAARLVLKSINIATGIESSKIEQEWKTIGDLGQVAETLTKKKKQMALFTHDLTVKKVFNNLKSLAGLEGPGTVDKKVKLIAELLTSAKPNEARYIIRTVLEDLRVGVGEGSIRDAIVWAFFPAVLGVHFKCTECKEFMPLTPKCLNCDAKIDKKAEPEPDNPDILKVKTKEELKDLNKYKAIQAENPREIYNHIVESVQNALDIANDFSVVAITAKSKGLKGLAEISLQPNRPVKVMLFQKVQNITKAFERVGKPAAFEFKYDGFRMEMHRDKDKITLYTRRLEDVTRQFPDVVELIKNNIKSTNFILDAEVIGIDPKTKKWMPFQQISQRIRRKYNIQEMTQKVPIMINLFDALEIDGENLLNTPFKERRAKIKKITNPVKEKLQLAEQIVTDDVEKAQKFYDKALKLGNEGLMAKNLESPYKPGSRVGHGVKLKPTMDNLDLVIVGAEWGTGKRSSWLSSFILACLDEETGEFVEIGRVGTGFKEKDEEEGVSFNELTEMLKPLIISEKGKIATIKPKIIIEVAFEEVQKSPTYNSGFALRFPRLVRLRDDKPASEASSLEMVEELYHTQRGK
ncbi:ATP-dependent DNA ligase [Nanoarchaeota archaeon]